MTDLQAATAAPPLLIGVPKICDWTKGRPEDAHGPAAWHFSGVCPCGHREVLTLCDCCRCDLLLHQGEVAIQCWPCGIMPVGSHQCDVQNWAWMPIGAQQ